MVTSLDTISSSQTCWHLLPLSSAASINSGLGFAGELWHVFGHHAVSFRQQCLNKLRWFSLIPLADGVPYFQRFGSFCSVAALHHVKY